MKDIIDFLVKNGFTKKKKNEYKNKNCKVIINEKLGIYELIDNNNGVMYSHDLNIYWLIGVLTYRGFMSKNYISDGNEIED